MTKTAQMRVIELEFGGKVEELLRDRLERGDTFEQIGKEWGITGVCVAQWARWFGYRKLEAWSFPEAVGASR